MPVPYLVLINLAAFLLMGIDKSRARRELWRIPEKVLFGSALLGGSVGAIAGMFFFRHKTRHLSFRLGLPVILLLQIVLYVWLQI
ncbi:MAG: DUF1294 domain-containing protein [Oscillospiraceae bacterium]|nr:DUF1294 domain-containing protein [Oscillospiraceae bacterium]MBQ7082244.1 DUF1294 domain-containing protein [Oscillospiraceae bacterium]